MKTKETVFFCECGNTKTTSTQRGCDRCRGIEKQRAEWDRAELRRLAFERKREKTLDAMWGIIDD